MDHMTKGSPQFHYLTQWVQTPTVKFLATTMGSIYYIPCTVHFKGKDVHASVSKIVCISVSVSFVVYI